MLDVFSKMMFGDSAEKKEKQDEKEAVSRPGEEETAEAVDYMHVMNQIGSIMNSLDQLKPVLKDLGPMVTALKKKIM
ncbi:uncharacterized protein S101359_01192 [Bacillus atrophaeus]|nr:uncharacterized protein S101359_01192 [Bacillus atrophaeus]